MFVKKNGLPCKKREIRGMVKSRKRKNNEKKNRAGNTKNSWLLWNDWATGQTIEECAELIQALSKLKYGEFTTENVMEELADVQIMLKQMFYLPNCEKDVKKVMAYKINRQLKRMI